MALEKINPVDAFGAIQQMKSTTGWKLLMEKYASEGDLILTQLLALDVEAGEKFTKRDLLAHQLHSLGRLQACLEEFEIDAKNEQMKRNEEPSK